MPAAPLFANPASSSSTPSSAVAPQFDVCIIGCGPVRAALANLLGMSGLRVVVLEREPSVYHLPRAVARGGEVCGSSRQWASRRNCYPCFRSVATSATSALTANLLLPH